MNIIFGREQVGLLSERYTVLELDTIRIMPNSTEVTAFCVLESIPILDMPRLESMKNLHENLMIEYRKRNWNYCLQALEHLENFWNGELDSFYTDLKNRIEEFVENEPEDNWDGVIVRS